MNVDTVIRIIDIMNALMTIAPALAVEFGDHPDQEKRALLERKLAQMRQIYAQASAELEAALSAAEAG